MFSHMIFRDFNLEKCIDADVRRCDALQFFLNDENKINDRYRGDKIHDRYITVNLQIQRSFAKIFSNLKIQCEMLSLKMLILQVNYAIFLMFLEKTAESVVRGEVVAQNSQQKTRSS